ncbi:calcium/sodium antiporter [bacterium]|nr:calcium/sodium antiporter [bacterium]
MDIFFILIGLALAIYGAHILVKGGSSLAERFNIPPLVIGSTIVAFGTSMPEFTVNMHSAFGGNTDLAIGNILGSNIFNLLLILGAVALFFPIKINQHAASKDFPMALIAALMIGICGNELYFDHINYHELMLSHGLIFFCFFAIFMYYTYHAARAPQAQSDTEDDAPTTEVTSSLPKDIILIILGLFGLVYGGDFIVDGATGMAKSMGLSERIIGLLIIGPGTSFPELIASIIAAIHKKGDMVIGNVLGSNIFNILFTLGATAMVRPVPLDLTLNYSVIFNIVATLILTIFVFVSRKKIIGRVFGGLLVASYIFYIIHAIMV